MRTAQPALQLALLGRFRLTGPDGEIDLGSRKLCGLLAYLACTAPGPQPRDRLMTLFWGSHFDAQARQNLRQALSRLRRALGNGVIAGTDEAVTLAADAVACDATAFETALHAGLPDALESAVALYQGSFLANVTIKEEAWADWAAAQRTRIDGLAVRALIRLGEHELDRGRNERALELADRAAAVDGLLEDAHRLSLRALAANGRRAEALKRHEQFAALLKRELSVAPDAATQALAVELRASGQALSDDADILLPLPDRPSIAVLPFANMSGDPDQEYFADGVVEDILLALSRVRWLFVIARQSSFSYKGRAVDVRRIGRELGVRYLVEGSVRKSGNRVRITAQLIDAEADAHIWADRFEGDVTDIFALQDEITERIVAAIEPSVQAIEIRRALAKATHSLTAYDSYLRALPDYHAQTKEALDRAEALLREAIALDPGYPEALGTLADCIAKRTLNGWHESRARGGDEACEAAGRALAAGPDNSTCVAAAAFAYAVLARRFEEAIELAAHAIALHPNSAFVRNRAGAVHTNAGESDKAIVQYEAAQRMNPRDGKSSAFAFAGGAAAHLFARRFEDSIRWGRRALAITPNTHVARLSIIASLGHLGRIEEARAEIAQLQELRPNVSVAYAATSSFQHEWMYQLYLEGLRKAGLPET